MGAAPTRTQHSPNGGQHLIFLVPTPVRQSAGALGPGVDTRSKGGYLVGAGSVIADGPYTADRTPLASAPAWLVDRCGPPAPRRDREPRDNVGRVVDPRRAIARATHYLVSEAVLAVEGHGGDTTTYRVAARVKDFGVSETEARALLWEHWNPRCSPPWMWEDLVEKIHHAYRYGVEPLGSAAPETVFPPVQASPVASNSVDALNDAYAFVLAGGGAHILWETTDIQKKYKLEHLSISAFHAAFANRKRMVGKRDQPISALWMEWKGRRSYEGVVFNPGQQTPERFYNLWRGFAVRPVDVYTPHPAVDAWLNHVRVNVCHGDDTLCRWFLGYVSHLVQRPWEKPLVALVLRGDKGVGKNAVIEHVGALLGGHFLLSSNRRYLVSNFNGHLENCLLFALDEAFWSGDKQAEGTLKDLVTGREHVIEHKGKEPYTVANRTRIVILGNDEWIVPASHDERRFAVFHVGDGRKQDRAFFTTMREGMATGGSAVLLRYLLDYDLTGIDVNAAPLTVGLRDQKTHSLDPLSQWWLDNLENGTILCSEFLGWPAEIECERFRAAFRRYVKERQIRSRLPEDRVIGRLLRSCAPTVVKKRASKNSEGGQPYVYALPELAQARAEWDTFIGHGTEWPAL